MYPQKLKFHFSEYLGGSFLEADPDVMPSIYPWTVLGRNHPAREGGGGGQGKRHENWFSLEVGHQLIPWGELQCELESRVDLWLGFIHPYQLVTDWSQGGISKSNSLWKGQV